MTTKPCKCGKCEECQRRTNDRFSRRGVLGAMVGAAAVVAGSAGAQQSAKQPNAAPDLAAALKKMEAEAFANLKAMYTAQKSYFAEQDRYSTDLDQIGFVPDEWCEDAARLRIKVKPTQFKKIGCHFTYEVETLTGPPHEQMEFRAYARGAVEPVLGINYVVDSAGEFRGIPRRNPR